MSLDLTTCPANSHQEITHNKCKIQCGEFSHLNIQTDTLTLMKLRISEKLLETI